MPGQLHPHLGVLSGEPLVNAVQPEEQLPDDEHRNRDPEQDQHVRPQRRLRGLDDVRGEVDPGDGDHEPERNAPRGHQEDQEQGGRLLRDRPSDRAALVVPNLHPRFRHDPAIVPGRGRSLVSSAA